MIPYQEKLLNDLETELNGSGLIGKAFVRFCPFLRMYPHFAQQYISLISVISSLCTSEESFFQFVKQFNQTCSVAHKKSLHDLLELPIYRPEQYSEVLKQLLRYTPEDHSDHGDLQVGFCPVLYHSFPLLYKWLILLRQKKDSEKAPPPSIYCQICTLKLKKNFLGGI